MTLSAALLLVGAALYLAVGFPLRTHLPAAVVMILAAASGVLVGLGAVGLTNDPSPTERVVAAIVLGALAPIHLRLLFAGEGPRRV